MEGGLWAAARGRCALWVVSHPDLPLLVISNIGRDLSSLQPTPHLHPNSFLMKNKAGCWSSEAETTNSLNFLSCKFVSIRGQTLPLHQSFSATEQRPADIITDPFQMRGLISRLLTLAALNNDVSVALSADWFDPLRKPANSLTR